MRLDSPRCPRCTPSSTSTTSSWKSRPSTGKTPGKLQRHLPHHHQRRPGALERRDPPPDQPPLPLLSTIRASSPPSRSPSTSPPAWPSATPSTPSTKWSRTAGMPSTIRGNFAGTALAYKASLASEWLLIATALLAVYIVLGILYESFVHPDHHPFHPALRRRRRGAGPDAHAHRPERHRAYRHHPAHRTWSRRTES